MTLSDRFDSLAAWLRVRGGTTAIRIAGVHAAAAIGLCVLAATGALAPVFKAGGVMIPVILALAGLHAIVGIRAGAGLDRGGQKVDTALSWLNHLDAAIPIVGFLGTLQGAIIELTSIDPTATGAGMVVMLKNVLGGVGIAVYCTLAGAAVALWTSTATAVLANALEAAKKAGIGSVYGRLNFPPASSPSRCETVLLNQRGSGWPDGEPRDPRFLKSPERQPKGKK